MMTAKFSLLMAEGAIVMDVRGHVGWAELGKDPVCAGASTLAMTVAQCVKDMEDAGKLQKKAHITIGSGRVTVVAKPQPEHFHEALHLFWMGETGMRLLEDAYPGYVQIKPFEAGPGDAAGTTQESGTDSINQMESST